MGGVYLDPITREPAANQSKAFRKNYAGLGYTYDETRDAFIPPKNFDSWILNEETCQWQSPVPHPTDGGAYTWNEQTVTWDLLENEA
jgi:accessory colonization factor AcfC